MNRSQNIDTCALSITRNLNRCLRAKKTSLGMRDVGQRLLPLLAPSLIVVVAVLTVLRSALATNLANFWTRNWPGALHLHTRWRALVFLRLLQSKTGVFRDLIHLFNSS